MVIGLFLALAAPARAALKVGIGDQQPAAYADARLRALKVPTARMIVPWDAATQARRPLAVAAATAAIAIAGAGSAYACGSGGGSGGDYPGTYPGSTTTGSTTTSTSTTSATTSRKARRARASRA